MKYQELIKIGGASNFTSVGFDPIYFERLEYLANKTHRKKIETLRFVIDKYGDELSIDWKPIDDQTIKKYGKAKKK